MKNNFEKRLESHGENIINSIDSPFNISEKIDEMEKENMNKKVISFSWLKKTAYSVASAAAALVLVFNLFPSLSNAASNVPILKDVVRIVTFGRFEVSEGNYEAEVVTPKIEGLLDKELEERLNAEFKENADSVIAAFEKDVKELSEEFGEDNFHLGVTADYVIRTDNENILSIDTYIVNTVASSSTTHRFYTIDKKTGALLELEALFIEDADYVTPISEYIKEEMKKQNFEGTGCFWIEEENIENFEKIKNDQNFFINNNGNIVICFDKYEVAAGAQGCPEFEIPGHIIENIRK